MTSTNSTTKKQKRIFPADFGAFITAVLEILGDGWALDDDHPTGLTAFLTHTDGRRIGITHLWRGEAIQTWAIDVPLRQFDEQQDKDSYADSLKHLTPGVRYNAGVTFTTSPPATATADTIRARLLPAYDGERPALRALPRKRRRTAASKKTAAATTEAKNATKTEPQTRGRSTAKPAAAKTSTPSRRSTKAAAPAKPRRTTTTATKTAKPRTSKAQPTETNS
ncbi:hypothetical protein ACQEVG_21535 [Streptomyces sp. CA-135486]|uniref:hypothetical protein n=1 Tax=Streptomyces sp. CA-135486 TaxID=3240049 RepID=UPI003D8ED904